MTDLQTPWRPACNQSALKARARLYAQVRAFFQAREVLEVDTPLASHGANPDPHTHLMQTQAALAAGGELYLATSPELAMKRLLAAGSGPIYQIAHAFRDGEFGRLHNPEFTLLEWYRPGFSMWELIDEVEALLAALGNLPAGPAQRRRYGDLFQAFLGVDPVVATATELQALCADADIRGSRQVLLDWLFSTVIQPKLHGCVFVTHFPAEQAALARLDPGDPSVAERFELIINGVEIANGFAELTDAKEQAARFEADAAQRRQLGLATVPIDHRFLAALEAGLPACSGVAVGLDRLLMQTQGAERLEQVLSFPLDRA